VKDNALFSISVFAAVLLFTASMSALPGCSKTTERAKKPDAQKPDEKHEAHHGGCLNAIETCAVGHAEVKLEGDSLKVWFVGGETETDKAVRVADKQIELAVTPEGGKEQKLTLEPRPIELAGEKIGDCSCFEGKADWLAGVKKFDATGTVNLKGRQRPLKIEFPDGYDPDDKAETKPAGTGK
jgi:hypothetical protein